MNILRPVDHAALRTNQANIIFFLVLAFILNAPLLVALVALVMLGGSVLFARPGFGWVYTRGLRRLGWVKPDILQDNREPHLFAQGFGGVFLVASAAALFGGAAVAGWILTWIVVALAALNLFGGFCVGCAVYYLLHRIGIPGFVKEPPSGTFPGLRPHNSLPAQKS